MGPILCAVDFSHQSAAALRWAAGIGKRRGSSLVIVHAVDLLLAHTAASRLGIDLTGESAQADLSAFAHAALPSSLRATAMTLRLTVGEPAQTIHDTAHAEHASLIVIGTQGLGGVQKLLLGSTAHRVLRNADLPVLVVPPQQLTTTPTIDPTSMRMSVLAATDFSPASVGVVSAAIRWSHDLAASLSIAHVVKRVDVPERWRGYIDSFEEEQVRVAERQLTALIRDRGGDTSITQVIVDLGDPAERIAAIAVEKSAGLIVLGLARASDHPRPGTVAYGVLRLSHIPVLVVPPETEPLRQSPEVRS